MTTLRQKLKRGDSVIGYFKGDYENDPVGLLAAEIVMHAIQDWRLIVRSGRWNRNTPNCNITELRKFFRSEWCEFLMQNFEIEPARILEILEAELQEAKEKAEQENERV